MYNDELLRTRSIDVELRDELVERRPRIFETGVKLIRFAIPGLVEQRDRVRGGYAIKSDLFLNNIHLWRGDAEPDREAAEVAQGMIEGDQLGGIHHTDTDAIVRGVEAMSEQDIQTTADQLLMANLEDINPGVPTDVPDQDVMASDALSAADKQSISSENFKIGDL